MSRQSNKWHLVAAADGGPHRQTMCGQRIGAQHFTADTRATFAKIRNGGRCPGCERALAAYIEARLAEVAEIERRDRETAA